MFSARRAYPLWPQTLLHSHNMGMAHVRFSTLVWIATAAKPTSVADALMRLPAIRLDASGGFVHILWEPAAWSDLRADAQQRVFAALRDAGVAYELAIGVHVGPAP